MRVNELDLIELAGNEIFEYHGIKVRVIEDTTGLVGCSKCMMAGRKACKVFECRGLIREDETDVYFVKATGRRKTAI